MGRALMRGAPGYERGNRAVPGKLFVPKIAPSPRLALYFRTSSSSTCLVPSAVRRLASTQPAAPPPTTM